MGSKIVGFFKIFFEILKLLKNFFDSRHKPTKTHTSYYNELFVQRSIWPAELKIDFSLFGGQKTLKIHFSP